MTRQVGPRRRRHVTRFAAGDVARLVLFGAGRQARASPGTSPTARPRRAIYAAVVDASSGAILLPPEPRQGRRQRPRLSEPPRRQRAAVRRSRGLRPGPRRHRARRVLYARTWSDINDDDDDRRRPRTIAARAPARTSSIPSRRSARRPGAAPAAPTRRGRARGTPPIADSWLTNRNQNGVQAFYLVAAASPEHLAGPTRSSSPTTGATSRSAAPAATIRSIAQRRRRRRTRSGDGGPDADARQQREHVDAARRRVAAHADVPLRGLRPPTRWTSATSTAATTPASLWHEYTHGLSNRLVIDADGVRRAEHAARRRDGRGVERLVRLRPAGPRRPEDRRARHARRDRRRRLHRRSTSRALRTQALDCPVGAVDALPAPAAPRPASAATRSATSARSPACPRSTPTARSGRETLWDLRQALRQGRRRHGSAPTSPRSSSPTAMRLSPPEPSMLDMRNAILAADQIDFGGALHDARSGTSSASAGWATSPRPSTAATPRRIEDFTRAAGARRPDRARSPASSPTRDTGLPLRGRARRPRRPHDRPGRSASSWPTTTGADGRYDDRRRAGRHLPEARLPAASAGYDPVVARDVAVDDRRRRPRVTRRCVRDWAALRGRRDDRGGLRRHRRPVRLRRRPGVFDQSPGTDVVGLQPDQRGSRQPARRTADGHAPAAARRSTSSTFLLDPSRRLRRRRLGDDARVHARDLGRRHERSRLAVDGTGANGFTDANIGALQPARPGRQHRPDVRYVRLTLLNPLRQGDDCAPNACSGTDFIDFSELDVLRRGAERAAVRLAGGGPHVGAAGHARDASRVVLHRSRLGDHRLRLGLRRQRHRRSLDRRPDDGVHLRRAPARSPRASRRRTSAAGRARRRARSPSPRRLRRRPVLRDRPVLRARARLRHRPPPGPPITTPTPAPLPTVLLSRRGTRQVTFEVTCRRRCDVLGKLTVSLSLAKRLGLPRGAYTLRKVERRVTSTNKQRFTLRLIGEAGQRGAASRAQAHRGDADRPRDVPQRPPLGRPQARQHQVVGRRARGG